MDFRGLQTTSWVTDTGEVVREESPLGLITVREPAERAQGLSVPGRIQADLLQAAAVVPITTERIDEPRDVRRLKLRLEGAELSLADVDGVGQTARWQRDRADGSASRCSRVPPILGRARISPPSRCSKATIPLIRAEAEQARARARTAIAIGPSG